MATARDKRSLEEQLEIQVAELALLKELTLANAKALELLDAKLEEQKALMTEYVELSKHVKFSLTILGYMEKCAIWIATVTASVAIVWTAWKYTIRETLNHLGK